MPGHSIHAAGGDHAHPIWDNAIEPVLEVEPGAEVMLEALDASGASSTRARRRPTSPTWTSAA